jgi:hypothetical protein
MNKDGHVLNAFLLSVGLAIFMDPTSPVAFARNFATVCIPVVLGALFPDVDTFVGTHRKTLHNLTVLGIFVAYPIVFDNLHYVWIGVLTHYVLDVFGSRRGIALFYPWRKEFGFPIGVPVNSKYATVMTIAVTGFELVIAAAIVFDVPAQVLRTSLSILGV